MCGLAMAIAISWDVWRGVSAGVAVALVVILLARYVLENHLRKPVRRAFDWATVPLLVLFVLYIVSDFLHARP